jgi:hypothetical protein
MDYRIVGAVGSEICEGIFEQISELWWTWPIIGEAGVSQHRNEYVKRKYCNKIGHWPALA